MAIKILIAPALLALSVLVNPAGAAQTVACSCPGNVYPCANSTPMCPGQCAGSPGTAMCNLMHYPLLVDTNQKIVSRSGSLPPLDADYDALVRASWEYMMNPGTSAGVPLCGQISTTCEDPTLPNYYESSIVGANTHNPADMFATMAESSLAYYAYTGNSKSLDIAIAGLDFFLNHGLTAPTDRWSSVPYAAAAPMSVTYSGDPAGNANGSGDTNTFWQAIRRRRRSIATSASTSLGSWSRTQTREIPTAHGSFGSIQPLVSRRCTWTARAMTTTRRCCTRSCSSTSSCVWTVFPGEHSFLQRIGAISSGRGTLPGRG
jgi:hypothetical protein